MSKGNMTRRAFIAATTTSVLAAGCATTGAKPNTAKVVPRKISPNAKINLGVIGGGGKGFTDMMNCDKTGLVNVVAIADPDWKRCEEGFYRQPNAKQYKDYRKMLDEIADIDACTISTPDHSHAPAAYMAMNMGKHVYVQKPLTHTIAEARLLRQVANDTGVVTQMGNQGHCGDGIRDMCEMIWSGAIGQVTECHVWTNRPIWDQGLAAGFVAPMPEQPVPATLDWDLWVGPSRMRPYNEAYCPWSWRGWWEFGCGAIGDMACHIMDAPFWSLKLYEAPGYTIETVMQEGLTEESGPMKSVTRFEVPARGEMGPVVVYWRDGGMAPDLPADLPPGTVLGDEGKNGSLFIGTNGYATTGEYGGNSRLLPDERMAGYTRPPQVLKRVPNEDPYLNWLTAIIEGGQAESHFDMAGPLTEMANFGNVAMRVGKKLEWDAREGKITNDGPANDLLTKEYRKGWELPC